MSMFASDLYGGNPSLQPVSTPAASHAGAPEPFAKTVATGTTGNPTALLVLLLGLAVALIHFSIRVDVSK